MYRYAVFFLFVVFSPTALAEPIKLITWNVESDRPNEDNNDPAVIGAQLTNLQRRGGPYDLISLTEVRDTSSNIYETAVEIDGINYTAATSSSGSSDRMMLMFRADRFNVVDQPTELLNDGRPNGITFNGGSTRRPFVVTLSDTENNNLNFKFMVNHLTRGNASNRQIQAEGLREWARLQTMPIVATGDYNFDYDFRNLTGNQSMAIFMRRGASDGGRFVWDWVIPTASFVVEGTSDANRRVGLFVPWVDTNWDDQGGNDEFRDSILDFVFLAKGARNWSAESRVVVRTGDFPDDNTTSDHRPVEATLDPDGTAVDVGGPDD